MLAGGVECEAFETRSISLTSVMSMSPISKFVVMGFVATVKLQSAS
jgi:hypothetical protein